MILRMKVHVVSTFAGLVVEARYGVKESGLSLFLELYTFIEDMIRLFIPMSNSQYTALDL